PLRSTSGWAARVASVALQSVLEELPPAIAAQPEGDASAARQLVLLLPAHNEELIIAATIRSAIAAGQDSEDIYVVNDSSTDRTEAIATQMLGADHVLSVERSGKALAVKQAIAHFSLEERYEWLHIADADSI